MSAQVMKRASGGAATGGAGEPTTTTVTTQAQDLTTTVTTTGEPTTTFLTNAASTIFDGQMVLSISGVNKTALETSVKTAIARSFNLPTSAVKVLAQLHFDRRLEEERRATEQADTWTITFQLTVSPSQVATLGTSLAAMSDPGATMSTTFLTSLKAALTENGVPQSTIDSVAVKSFFAFQVGAETTTKGPTPAGTTSSGMRPDVTAAVFMYILFRIVGW